MSQGEPVESYFRLGQRRAPSAPRAAEMVEVNMQYARRFLDGDFEGMEDFLIETPVFEHYPQAMRIVGREAVRVRSERSFTVTRQFDPRRDASTHRITAVCFAQDALVHEFSNVFAMPDGTKRRCYLAAVVTFDGDKMIGERVYTDSFFARIIDDALGPDFIDLPGVTLL